MDWRQAEILDLISMYRESECLWNCVNPEYKDLDLKKTAWREIADHFERDVGEVKKKIKHLRTNYVVEKKKVDSKKYGDSGESMYEPRLFYYDEMTFLDPVVVLRACSLVEPHEDPLRAKKPKRAINERPVIVEKRQRVDSTDDELETPRSVYRPTDTHSEIDEAPPESPLMELETSTDVGKEETFCAMLCSELKLIKSEEIYDNVTLEIFAIVKNAKMAERQIIYQPEEERSTPNKRT
ncbi:uncharacterized protein LOC129237670 [Anastrepha obliqua]|uniref:uncharacterized protein LOC129237670 n=1 Tax=Anastrepha obliqua TaxID=95512 RepID=UPI00240925E1|nr:uncharacterized protein LOC129237670 [Anastrepha obliqua]